MFTLETCTLEKKLFYALKTLEITKRFIPAEKFLESIEVNQNYPAILLHLVEKVEIDITIRIAGAIAFKNYIKRNWKVVSRMDNVV